MKITITTTREAVESLNVFDLRKFLSENGRCSKGLKKSELVDIAWETIVEPQVDSLKKEKAIEEAHEQQKIEFESKSSRHRAFRRGCFKVFLEIVQGAKRLLKKSTKRLSDWRTAASDLKWVTEEITYNDFLMREMYGVAKFMYKQIDNPAETLAVHIEDLKDDCRRVGFVQKGRVDCGYHSNLEDSARRYAKDVREAVVKQIIDCYEDYFGKPDECSDSQLERLVSKAYV